MSILLLRSVIYVQLRNLCTLVGGAIETRCKRRGRIPEIGCIKNEVGGGNVGSQTDVFVHEARAGEPRGGRNFTLASP